MNRTLEKYRPPLRIPLVEEREKGTEKIFKVMADSFPNVMKNTDVYIPNM